MAVEIRDTHDNTIYRIIHGNEIRDTHDNTVYRIHRNEPRDSDGNDNSRSDHGCLAQIVFALVGIFRFILGSLGGKIGAGIGLILGIIIFIFDQQVAYLINIVFFPILLGLIGKFIGFIVRKLRGK